MAHNINTRVLNTIVRTPSVNAYIDFARKQQPLSESEIEALIAKGDDISKNKVVNSYSLFMLSLAAKFAKGDEVLELVSCATIGMKEAMKSFDASRGFKFISYAVHYMYMEISKYFREVVPMIRRPMDAKIGSKANRISDKFFAENGRYPSEDEVINALKDEFGIEVATTDIVRVRVSSMDAQVSSDEDSEVVSEVGEIATATASHNEYEDEIEREDKHHIVSRALRVLTMKERNVVEMAYGLGEYNNVTYSDEDIAEKYALTKERVRQIREGALKKLQSCGKRALAM